MATVCVGCGLDVDGQGRIRVGPNAPHLETSYVDRVGFSVPTTYDSQLGPILTLEVTNPSDCMNMLLKASIEGNVKLGWDPGTELFVVFPECSVGGGSWTSGSQVGIAGPPHAHTEGRYVNPTFIRQVDVLAPGETTTVAMRFRVRTQNAVTAVASDVDMVFGLDCYFVD